MFFVVYLAAECGALKRTCAEVEGKRYQRIELPLRGWHANQAQHSAFCDRYILTKQDRGLRPRPPRLGTAHCWLW